MQDKITKQFTELLKKENSQAIKESEDKFLEIAYILLFIHLQQPKNNGYSFRFPKSVDITLAKLRTDLYAIFLKHSENAITLSVFKNEKLLGLKLATPDLKKWINRAIQDITLKNRIAKYVQMYKMELEARIAMGIVNQENPNIVIKEIKLFLKKPYDNLSVRTKADWKARRLAIKYKPKTGKYQSAVANLERLLITEITGASRRVDYLIWKNQKRVMGVLVTLSPSHPAVDICDSLVGIYPKGFYFSGFHPRCLCIATPITTGTLISGVPNTAKDYMSQKEMKKWYSKLPFYNNNKKYWK